MRNFFTIFSIALGTGFLRLRNWAYNWGLGTAIINTIWFGYNYSKSNLLIFLFLLLVELLIVILLYTNRMAFETDIINEENEEVYI